MKSDEWSVRNAHRPFMVLSTMNPTTCTQSEQITPVQQLGDYWFKREDLYQPFAEPLNGSKVRQALHLISSRLEHIRINCNGMVATISSVHSPQGYIVARCAQHFGLRSFIGIGVSEPDRVIAENKPFQMAADIGADIQKLAGVGYNTVLDQRMKALAIKNKWFVLSFGFGGASTVNAAQVVNLPNDLDHLVIPCGSGITATAVLAGLSKREAKHRAKNIHVVQIAGMNRTIRSTIPFNFVKDKTYPYSKKVKIDHEGLELDWIYEAKAFAWMQRENLNGKTLFYTIANFNWAR